MWSIYVTPSECKYAEKRTSATGTAQFCKKNEIKDVNTGLFCKPDFGG